mgnify:CR=1 FL=1
MTCPRCNDTKEILIEKDTHFDRMPCPECQPPLSSCAKGHVAITGHFFACPLCAALAQVRAYRAAERPQPRLQTDAVGDGKGKVTIAEEKQ